MPELDEGEVVIRKGPASYQLNQIMIGGYLFLTNKKLYLDTHSMEIVKAKVIIPLKEVQDVAEGSGENEMVLHIYNKKSELFTVYERKDWISDIQSVVETMQ